MRFVNILRPLLSCLVAPALVSSVLAAPSWDAPPGEQQPGRFWRYHWYERGLTNGNPAYETRFRINSPEVVLHPTFGKRTEARENGLMLIRAEEDLFQVTGAEFYAEMWGGHPGTANKRVTVNGRSTHFLPRVGTEEGHCTYFYPAVPLRLTDLVNGYDAFQFALDQGTTFWGHSLIDNAAVRVALTNSHRDLVTASLAGFEAVVRVEPMERASVEASPSSTPAPFSGSPAEGFRLGLATTPAFRDRIASVDFQGWYAGYDENGNLRRTDWHGFTKQRRVVAHLGTVDRAPFALVWDTSMLPAQPDVAVRAVVHFRGFDNLVYLTQATTGLAVADRRQSEVVLFAPHDSPAPFWSRANQKKTCDLDLDIEPARIERAELHVVAWTGGAGTVKDYFRLNGVHYPVAEGERHELSYTRLPIDPKTLKRGRNLIEVLSDTAHHGIEVLGPGPALMVRLRR